MLCSRSLQGALFCVPVVVSAIAAAPSTPAVLNVTDSVIVANVEPLGANIGTVMGGTNFATNQFMKGTGFEPAAERWLRRIDRAGPNWLEWDSDGGVHMWDLDSTGFGNGASVRIYRIVDASGQPLAWSTGAAMENPAGADHVVLVGAFTVPMPGGALPRGGWIADGSSGTMNRVYLDRDVTLYRGDYVFIKFDKMVLRKSEINGRLYQYNSDIESVGHMFKPAAWSARLVTHPGAPLPQAFLDDDPGESCYELTATTTARENIGQWLFHAYDNGEGQWYGTLIPGARYRVDVWLRQEGLGNAGKVRFNSNQRYNAISATWDVTGTWQKYSYEFNGPNYPDGDAWHHYFGLEVTGPGKLWVDNWAVYQYDAAHANKPFSPCTLGYNEYLRTIPSQGRKPTARFYPSTFPTVSPMSRRLSNWASSGIDFIRNLQPGIQITIPHCLEWAYKSGTNAETRIVPYFTLRVEDTEEDWKALVEYLGVPYDPTGDTPQSKPWAYLRYTQRGIGTPWTDEFREIIIEYGNESWHNGAGGYGWYGFSRSGYVWAGGIEYGLFARYMFDQQVGGMPEWTQYNLGNKIKFALNGGYMVGADQYGENSVRKTSGAVKYVTHANYVGPKWETGQTPNQTFDSDGMQRTMIGADPDFKLNYLAKHAQFRDEARALGVNYELVMYEGGPSGYYVSGATDAQKIIAEQYGKSVGMAVAALDAWMYSSYVGYTHQNYLGYGCGGGWSSHTAVNQGGFRQHIGWMAMALRNNHVRGDRLLRAEFGSLPTYQDAAVVTGDIPLVAAYALNNTEKSVYSVMLLSRKLGGTHSNGVDFGDGFTPVTINLPFTQRPQAVYLYRLARRDGSWTDPMLSNRDSLRVVIRCDTINPATWSQAFVVNNTTGADSRGLPPGNIFLYVFALDTAALALSPSDPSELFNARRNANVSFNAPPSVSDMRWETLSTVDQPSATTRGNTGLYPKVVTGQHSTSSTVDVTTVILNPQSPVVPQVSTTVPDAPALPSLASVGATVRGDRAVLSTARGTLLPQSLTVVSVSASSFLGKHRPANTLDRTETTRWTPSTDGYQWIAYDLGVTQKVGAVAFAWYRRSAGNTPAAIETSSDGVRWTLAWRGFLSGRGVQRAAYEFALREVRFVRMTFDGAARPVSLSELGVYESAIGDGLVWNK